MSDEPYIFVGDTPEEMMLDPDEHNAFDEHKLCPDCGGELTDRQSGLNWCKDCGKKA